MINRIARWNKKEKELPEEYRFDVEDELINIEFVKEVADKEENFRNSLEKEEEHRTRIEVQNSVKAGIREFIHHEDPLVRNLVLLMILWFIIVMNYQINDWYDDEYDGTSYDDDINMATIEFIGYIFADLIFDRLGYRQCTKLFVISFIMSIIIGIGMIINDAE